VKLQTRLVSAALLIAAACALATQTYAQSGKAGCVRTLGERGAATWRG